MSMATQPILAFWYQLRATGDETRELGKSPGGRQQKKAFNALPQRIGSDVGQLPYCYI
jgi:hypothetical protein